MGKKIIAVCDCETDPFKHGRIPAPFVWGLYYISRRNKERFEIFYHTEAFIERIEQLDAYVYAHNGGKFDFFYLLPHCIKTDQKEIKIINGRIVEFHIGKATMRDSWNILPVPLAKINKDKFDYSKLESNVRLKYKEEIEQYLYSDCKNLYDAVSAFIDEFSNVLTVAGAGLKTWRKMAPFIPFSTLEYHKEMKQFYYGGRVSVFKPGVFNGNFKVYDIKSAYPYAMLSQHPYGTHREYCKEPSKKDIKHSFLTVKCFSEGALPLRTKTGITFPYEYNTYYITGWELIAGIETNTIHDVNIISSIVFRDLIDFKPYVNNFYEMKLLAEKNNDKTRRTFAKLLLNSLYGKFAQDSRNFMDYILGLHGEQPPDGFDYGPVMGDIQLFSKQLDESKWKFLNVATSASITGYVRAYLWRNINKCKNVYYCDTDCIMCENGNALDVGENLGQWELQNEAYKIAIAGKKLYALYIKDKKSKVASKGVHLTDKEIEMVANGSMVTYKPDIPTYSLKTGIRFTNRNIRSTA